MVGMYAATDGLSNGCSTIGISKQPRLEVMTDYPVLFEEYSLHEVQEEQNQGGFGVNYKIKLLRGDS